jgi:hypothetical protein
MPSVDRESCRKVGHDANDPERKSTPSVTRQIFYARAPFDAYDLYSLTAVSHIRCRRCAEH